MPPLKCTLPLLFLSLAFASSAYARGTIEKVDITGLDRGDDAEIIENIEVSLSLYDTIGKEQGESRLEYLLSQAERQTKLPALLASLALFGFDAKLSREPSAVGMKEPVCGRRRSKSRAR